jgi:hypothetical protein
MPRHFANTAADPLLPRTPVTINGREYNLCFDFRALREAELAFSQQGHRAALISAMNDPFMFENVCRVFPCALRRFHPEITWDDAQAMVDLGSVDVIAMAIYEAKRDASPKPNPEEDQEQKANPTEP